MYVALLAGASLFALGFGGERIADGPSGPFLSVGDLLLRLGAVVAVAYVSLLGLRAYAGRGGGGAADSRGIRVVERCRLAQQQTLYVVTVDGRALLLGATASSIANLAELGESERYLAQAPEAGATPFSQHLRAFGFLAPIGGSASGQAAGTDSNRMVSGDGG